MNAATSVRLPDNALELSWLKSKTDNMPRRDALSWSELVEALSAPRVAPCSADDCPRSKCEHKNGRAWSPAVYPPGAARKGANVESVTVLVIDLDHMTPATFTSALASLDGYRRILHSSHSDRDDDRCIRAVVTLSRPVLKAEWPRFWTAAMSALGQPADPACCDANRLYFLPSHPRGAAFHFEAHDGNSLDVDDILAGAAQGDLAPQTSPIAQALTLDATGTVAEGQRHAMLKSLAGSVRFRGAGLAEITAALQRANRDRCSPPKPDDVVTAIAEWAAEQPVSSRTPPQATRTDTRDVGSGDDFWTAGGDVPPRHDEPKLDEMGNGQRFARRFGTELRYVQAWRGWLCWDGARWRRDEIGVEIVKAKAIARGLYADAAALALRAAAVGPQGEATDDGAKAGKLAGPALKWAAASSKATALRAMATLAQTEVPIAATADAFDRDAWALNVLNGTIDLRTGTLQPHRREDMITMLAPVAYDPAATAPTWEAFLTRVLPDEEVRAWVQRFAGYALTGDVGDEIVTFLYGTGANGKSKFLGALQYVLGDYAMQGSPGLLLASDRGGDELGRRQRAGLRGRRLVLCQEVESGTRLNESQVKQISGGDKITAARLYENEIEFLPTHKLVVATNFKPKVKGQDEGIWRRLRLVPFTVTIPPEERDRGLAAKLEAEAAGILAWCVRGCLDWQRDGLREPKAVRAATAAYRDDEDRLAEFLEGGTEVGQGYVAPVSDLYEAYSRWCKAHDEAPWSKGALLNALEERGFTRSKGYVGLKQVRIMKGLQVR